MQRRRKITHAGEMWDGMVGVILRYGSGLLSKYEY